MRRLKGRLLKYVRSEVAGYSKIGGGEPVPLSRFINILFWLPLMTLGRLFWSFLIELGRTIAGLVIEMACSCACCWVYLYETGRRRGG